MDRKSTILVVEDNEFNMAMAKDLLDLAGFETLQAEDADHGILLAKTHHPDLILMDMHLPVMDGYEATRQIKTLPETHAIPVVAFTALAMEDEQDRAIQSGCSGVINKPINVDTFAQSVAAFLPLDLSPSPESVRSCAQDNHVDLPVTPPSATTIPSAVNHPQREEDLEDFLYRVSHDLQSPLRKMRQFSHFLKAGAKDELSPENYELLEALDRSAQQMSELLSDLLHLARISRAETHFTTFKVFDAVSEAIRMNKPVIETEDAKIELGKLDPDLMVEGIFSQWIQLFCQLLQNALKFHSPHMRPRIRIENRTSPDNPDWISISVQDNGIGLRPENAEKIFHPMHRLHGVSKYGGTGIGLAIVKKIVDAHEGFIQVDSQPEQGATFTIKMPLSQKKHIEAMPTPSA